MANLSGLGAIVAQLREERTNLINQLRHVDAALSVLGKLDSGRFYTKPRRTLSASARRKIAAAQRARWAKLRSSQSGRTDRSTKRTMSAVARRKIAGAA
jgi:hypothetical protein